MIRGNNPTELGYSERTLRHTFFKYAGQQDSGDEEHMTGSSFLKLCKETGIADERHVTSTDVDIEFAKATAGQPTQLVDVNPANFAINPRLTLAMSSPQWSRLQEVKWGARFVKAEKERTVDFVNFKKLLASLGRYVGKSPNELFAQVAGWEPSTTPAKTRPLSMPGAVDVANRLVSRLVSECRTSMENGDAAIMKILQAKADRTAPALSKSTELASASFSSDSVSRPKSDSSSCSAKRRQQRPISKSEASLMSNSRRSTMQRAPRVSDHSQSKRSSEETSSPSRRPSSGSGKSTSSEAPTLSQKPSKTASRRRSLTSQLTRTSRESLEDAHTSSSGRRRPVSRSSASTSESLSAMRKRVPI